MKMSKEIDIVALGELLIDFTESGYSKNGMKLFEQNPGGAPANLLTAASHMGCSTAFVGKVGNDMHGHFLKETLKKEGIDTRAVIEDTEYFTTMAFVELDERGERSFSFARKPGADTMLRKEELDENLLSKCKISIASKAGVIISYDPNYRASLWKSGCTAVEEMKKVISLADIMKVSDEESLLLTGASNYEDASDEFLKMGIKLVAITLGKQGVLVARKGQREIFDAFSVNAVDTTGAGDSFWGGFLSRLLSYNQAIEKLEWKEIGQCALTGNAVAALCVQSRGGIPSIPGKDDVELFIRNNRKRCSYD